MHFFLCLLRREAPRTELRDDMNNQIKVITLNVRLVIGQRSLSMMSSLLFGNFSDLYQRCVTLSAPLFARLLPPSELPFIFSPRRCKLIHSCWWCNYGFSACGCGWSGDTEGQTASSHHPSQNFTALSQKMERWIGEQSGEEPWNGNISQEMGLLACGHLEIRDLCQFFLRDVPHLIRNPVITMITVLNIMCYFHHGDVF